MRLSKKILPVGNYKLAENQCQADVTEREYKANLMVIDRDYDLPVIFYKRLASPQNICDK